MSYVLRGLFVCLCDGCLEGANECRMEDASKTPIGELFWSELRCNVVNGSGGRFGSISLRRSSGALHHASTVVLGWKLMLESMFGSRISVTMTVSSRFLTVPRKCSPLVCQGEPASEIVKLLKNV